MSKYTPISCVVFLNLPRFGTNRWCLKHDGGITHHSSDVAPFATRSEVKEALTKMCHHLRHSMLLEGVSIDYLPISVLPE